MMVWVGWQLGVLPDTGLVYVGNYRSGNSGDETRALNLLSLIS